MTDCQCYTYHEPMNAGCPLNQVDDTPIFSEEALHAARLKPWQERVIRFVIRNKDAHPIILMPRQYR